MPHSLKHSAALALVGAAVLFVASFTAHAATTFVHSQGNFGNERCLVGVGGMCSGGSYNNTLSMMSVFRNDLNLTLGAGHTLVRVDDNFDQLWANAVDNGGQVQALARYAGDNSVLGYNPVGPLPYQALITPALDNGKVVVNNAGAYAGEVGAHTTDFVVNPDSWVTIPVAAGAPYAFVLNDQTLNTFYSSNPSSNAGSFDHMVTFQVYLNGVAQEHFFIAWEDRKHNSDKDYNDYIAEVRFTPAIPEPEIYAMMVAGLGLMGFVGRRRRRQGTVS